MEDSVGTPGLTNIGLDLLFGIYDELDVKTQKYLQESCISKDLRNSWRSYWEFKVQLSFGIAKGTEFFHRFLCEYPNPGSALAVAIKSKSTERYAELITASAFGTTDDLKQACFYERVNVVKHLLANSKINPAIDDNYCIKVASHLGNVRIVEMLLQTGKVNPAADDNYSIVYASQMGRTEVVNLLLQTKKVNSKAQSGRALTKAIERNHYEIIKLLQANS